MNLLLKGGTVLTMDGRETVLTGDVRIAGTEITEIGENLAAGDEQVIDCTGLCVMPGFVQAHVHLCQTLFRNLADDLELLDWLTARIWPFEAWHTIKA